MWLLTFQPDHSKSDTTRSLVFTRHIWYFTRHILSFDLTLTLQRMDLKNTPTRLVLDELTRGVNGWHDPPKTGAWTLLQQGRDRLNSEAASGELNNPEWQNIELGHQYISSWPGAFVRLYDGSMRSTYHIGTKQPRRTAEGASEGIANPTHIEISTEQEGRSHFPGVAEVIQY